MLTRYKYLYEEMAGGSKVEKMKVFGNAEKWLFEKIAESHPDIAQEWLDKLESSVWNNYVSQKEYEGVCDTIENLDGSRGCHWSYNEVMSAIHGLDGVVEDAPCYNTYALALTMNMLYSDHSESVRSYVREEDILPFYYAMSIDKLKDPDRANFVRPYFGL